MRLYNPATFALTIGAGICAVLIGAGCPGEIDNPDVFLTGAGGGACPDVETEIFVTKCSEQAGCHNADDMAASLDLGSPGVESRIVGVPGTSTCSGEILADPNDAASSLLYTKLTDAPTCGTTMPFGADPLSDAEIACVEQYIAGLTPTGPGAGGGGMGGSAEAWAAWEEWAEWGGWAEWAAISRRPTLPRVAARWACRHLGPNGSGSRTQPSPSAS